VPEPWGSKVVPGGSEELILIRRFVLSRVSGSAPFARPLLKPLLAVALAGATMLSAGVGPAAAQGEVKSVYGDWQIRCDSLPGAQSEQCALIQNVTAADRENVGLSVIVLKTADKSARILRVLAPLGVLLPSGLGLRVAVDAPAKIPVAVGQQSGTPTASLTLPDSIAVPLQPGDALVARNPDRNLEVTAVDGRKVTLRWSGDPASELEIGGLDLNVGRAGFVRCLPNGCIAEVMLDDALITKLRAGQTATFIIFQTPEEGIGIPISLSGFGEGFDALP